jgi:hypothetical protein
MTKKQQQELLEISLQPKINLNKLAKKMLTVAPKQYWIKILSGKNNSI